MSINVLLNSTTWIALNVGGKHFKTTVDTIQSSRFLRSLVSGNWLEGSPITTSSDTPENIKVFRINRCGGIFKHILRLLLDPSYDYPMKYVNELDYYGIDYIRPTVCRTTDEKIDLCYRHIAKYYCQNIVECTNECIPNSLWCPDCVKVKLYETQNLSHGDLVKIDGKDYLFYIAHMEFTGETTAVVYLLQYYNGRWVYGRHASNKDKLKRYIIDHPSIITINV